MKELFERIRKATEKASLQIQKDIAELKEQRKRERHC